MPETSYILEIRLAAADVLDKPLVVPFRSMHDTLTLARTVCEAIQSIKAGRSDKGKKRAPKTAQVPQLV